MIVVTCRELVEIATDAREGALGGWRSAQVRAHLAVCGHCRRYVAQLDRAIAIGRESTREEDAPIDRALLAKLRARAT